VHETNATGGFLFRGLEGVLKLDNHLRWRSDRFSASGMEVQRVRELEQVFSRVIRLGANEQFLPRILGQVLALRGLLSASLYSLQLFSGHQSV